MSPRSGVGVLETAVLSACADLGALPGAGYRRTTRVLDRLESTHGIGASYAYDVMRDLQAPYRVHLPLLDGQGNWGSQGDDPPADAKYTELRLSPVGALAVQAELAECGPVPLGLIEGSLYRGGSVPPFDPVRVVAALVAGTPDVGGPVLPTGGPVEGDIAALLAGKAVRLQLGSRIEPEDGRLVVTRVPLGVSPDVVEQSLASRAHSSGGRRYVDHGADHEANADAPVEPRLVDRVRNESSMRVGTRIVCTLAEGADVDAVERWVRSVWPVTVEVDCRLPAPMRRRLRGWDAGDGSGLRALADLLPISR